MIEEILIEGTSADSMVGEVHTAITSDMVKAVGNFSEKLSDVKGAKDLVEANTKLGAFEQIEKLFKSVVAKFKDGGIMGIINTIGAAISTFLTYVGSLFSADSIKAMATKMGERFAAAMKFIVEKLSGSWENVKAKVSSAYTTVKMYIGKIWAGTVDLWKAFEKGARKVGRDATSKLGRAWRKLVGKTTQEDQDDAEDAAVAVIESIEPLSEAVDYKKVAKTVAAIIVGFVFGYFVYISTLALKEVDTFKEVTLDAEGWEAYKDALHDTFKTINKWYFGEN